MTWKANLSHQMSVNEARAFVEEKFKKIYPFEEKNGVVLFSLHDGSTMKVVSLGSEFNSLVMDYTSGTDSDDGDMYPLDDFTTLESLFNAMLEETKL